MKTFDQFLLESNRRISFTRVYHGTPSAEKIHKQGFKTSEVHASTSGEIAHSFGGRHAGDTRVIPIRVPSKSIKSQAPTKALKTTGQRGIDKWGREHFSVIMSPDYATKHIDNRPFISAPKTMKGYEKNLLQKYQRRTNPFSKRTK
jgi:hypothetical protein